MSIRARVWLSLLAFLLAGCATSRRANTAGVPDWEEGPAKAETVVLRSASNTPPENTQNTIARGTRAPGPSLAETWIPLQRWARAYRWVSLNRLTSAAVPTFLLHSTNGALTLSTGSQSAHWDGVEFRLGFAPQWIDEQPYLHAADLRTSVQPLLEGRPGLELSASPVIVIDPGHGGENSGTHSVIGNHSEKEFTLDWARRLQGLLAAQGWRAYLTRSNDSDLALSNRVAFAVEHHADLFLSLHFNSAFPNQTEAGLETYCLTPLGMPSTLTRGFDDETEQVFPNNAFDAQNLELALRVHRALLAKNKHQDRGVRRARFPGVLRGQRCPAILIEGGYLSNPDEARHIEDGDYRQKLAEAIANALVKEGQVVKGSLPGGSARPESESAQSMPGSEPTIQR